MFAGGGVRVTEQNQLQMRYCQGFVFSSSGFAPPRNGKWDTW